MPLGWLHTSFIAQTCQLFTRAKKLLEWGTVLKIAILSWLHSLAHFATKSPFTEHPAQRFTVHATAQSQTWHFRGEMFLWLLYSSTTLAMTNFIFVTTLVNYILFGIMVVEYLQPTQWQLKWHWEVLNVCVCSYWQVAVSCLKYYIHVHT